MRTLLKTNPVVVPLADKLPEHGRTSQPEWMNRSLPSVTTLFADARVDWDPSHPDVVEYLARAKSEAAEEARVDTAVKLDNLAARFEKSIAKLELATQSVETIVAKDVVDLALVVAEAMCRREFSENRNHLVELVRASLAEMPRDDAVVVRLSREDYLWIADRADLEAKHVVFEADERLQHGECEVFTPERIIDATLASRLGTVRAALYSELAGDQASDAADGSEC